MYRRILLVKPPERSSFNFGTFSLATLAAVTRDVADVSILDATALSFEEASDSIVRAQPDLVGITVMGADSVRPVADFLRTIRATAGGSSADVHVLVGGHGASSELEPMLAAGADAVVIGEGELTFRNVVQFGIRHGSPGLASQVDGRITRGPAQDLIAPLDRLPSPARDLMQPPPDGIHLMEASRGCPHYCSFCETTRFYRRRWRHFSIERITAEIERLVMDYDAWVIHFADDNFTANTKWAVHLCRAIQKGPMPAFFVAFARGDDLLRDPALLPEMAAARILRINVGVETLDEETAATVGKPVDPGVYPKVFEQMRRLGMFSVASFIVGLPGETAKARASAVARAIEAGPDSAHFIPFQPLPGTPLARVDGHEPDPVDTRDAASFTEAFSRNPASKARLVAASQGDNVRGLLARGAIGGHPANVA